MNEARERVRERARAKVLEVKIKANGIPLNLQGFDSLLWFIYLAI